MNRVSIDRVQNERSTPAALALATAALAVIGPLATPAAAQYCTDSKADDVFIEMIPGATSVPSTAPLCLDAFHCDETEIGPVQPERLLEPGGRSFTVRVKVPLTMPDNSRNDGTGGTDVGFRARVHWFKDAPPDPVDCYPGFNGCNPHESCGPLGATIDFDSGFAAVSIGGLTCENVDSKQGLGTYYFTVLRCGTPAGTCTTRADSPPIVLTAPALKSILCPEKHNCCDECEPCPEDSGLPVDGNGAAVCPLEPANGAGAALGYTARGAGTPGLPGSELWRPVLGRGWSHDYAERIVVDPDDSHVWLITRFGTYREFWNPVGGVYQGVSPSNEYRTLTRTASGWELRELDGTVHGFAADGRWDGTADASGNAKLPTYDGAGTLTEVAFPDGRRELFTYHPDGKLAAIEELGVAGAASRTWSYSWTGDDLTRIDRPDGTAAEYFYNDPRYPGYLTRIDEVATDGARRVTKGYEYDGHGNAVRSWRGETVAGANGDAPGTGAVNVWALSFDDPERPAQTLVTDPLGNGSTYLFERDPVSEAPRITSISGSCPTCGLGPNTQFFYDDPDNPLRPTRMVDGRGTQTLMAWDGNGQMTSRTEAFGSPLERTMTWEYADPAFPAIATKTEQPSTSGAGSRETRIQLDGAGNPVIRTISGIENGSAFSLDTVTTYTAEGRPQSVDPPGYGAADQTSFTYDPARGNLLPLSRSDPLIGATAFAYDPFNRRAAITDPNGVTTETVYDALGRLRFTIQKGATALEDLVTEQVYNTFGDLARTILPRGNIVEFTYDDVGRLVTIASGPAPGTALERIVFTLDAFGNRTRVERQRWEAGNWVIHSSTDYVFSSRCHLDKVVYPDGSATEYAYDCNGNLERVWDANHPSAGQATTPTQTYTYDELNRLLSVSEPWAGEGGGQATTASAYDVQDHLARITDAEGNVTTFTYSDRDLLTEEISEVSGRTEYAYNDHGELVRETDARQVTVRRTVDELDRVVFVDYPENALDTAFTYDDPTLPFSRGRLTAITRDGEAVAYGYDRFGRVTRDGALTFTYDENDNRVTIGYPENVTATYTYDSADRQSTLTLATASDPPQPLVIGAEYLPLGPLSRLDLGNGLSEIRDFDERYFPQGIAVPGQLDWDYSTDAVGNILGITDTLHGQSRSFEYLDVHYYLTRGDGPWGDRSWTYDKIGNRLSEIHDGVVDSYRYPANGSGGRNPRLGEVRHGSDGITSYFYDAAGNQTYSATEDEKLRLGYDAEGRLAQITSDVAETTGRVVRFRYDGRGFLTSSELRPYLGRPPSIVTTPTYDSEGRLYHKRAEAGPGPRPPRDEAATTSDSFVLYFSARPVGIFDRLAETDGQGQTTESSRLRLLSTDHLGTPVLATDDSGALSWSGGFEPFGLDYADAQEAGQFLRLPGQWVDGSWSSVLSYNVHRWLENRTGRYSRADPLGISAGEEHLYAYAALNPIRLVDPLGLESRICCRPIKKAGALDHCYLEIKNPRGTTTCGLQNINGVGEIRADFPDDSGGDCGKWSPPCADECAIRVATSYPNPSEYSIKGMFVGLGANSNTFTSEISKACGQEPPAGVGFFKTPGWGHAPPNPEPGRKALPVKCRVP